jgi:hypothetical protein
MAGKEPEFSYFLNQKKTILVVSFLGHLASANTKVLERCMGEIKVAKCHYVVMNFKALQGLAEDQVPNLVIFQQNIRDLPAELILCELSATVKRVLENAGSIRSYEVKPTLIFALQHIVNTMPK